MRASRAFTYRLLAAALTAASLTAGFASIAAAPAYAQQAEKQSIIVHLGSFTNDLHAAFMAVTLATNMQKAGANVTMFLDREGVRLADTRERGDLTWGDSGPISKALSDFTAAGGKVVLCPHCAQLAGVAKENLRPGTRIATHEETAKLFIDADKIVDY